MYIIISSETEFLLNIYNSVRTSQEPHYVSSTKANGMMLREKSPSIMRAIQNTQIYSVGIMQNFILFKQMVHIEPRGFKELIRNSFIIEVVSTGTNKIVLGLNPVNRIKNKIYCQI